MTKTDIRRFSKAAPALAAILQRHGCLPYLE